MDELLNWLWQGCAVTLGVTAILRARAFSAATRYYLWWATAGLVLLLPLAPAMSWGTNGVSAAAPAVHVAIPSLPEWPFTSALLIWGAWIAVSTWRASAALVSLRRAKRACRPFPLERERRLVCWRSLQAHGRRAPLKISDDVRSAAVFGLWSPIVVVSPTLLCELNDQELDQVLVHEWAHVQRRDDLACFVQVILRGLVGLHPAVWWIDRRLTIEREVACDDWAVGVTGSSRGYASCLTRLATLHAKSREALLVPGALSGSVLTTRVFRLLDRRRNASPRRSLAAFAGTMPVMLAVVLVVASVRLAVMAIPAIPALDFHRSWSTVSIVPNVHTAPARQAARSSVRPRQGDRPRELSPTPAAAPGPGVDATSPASPDPTRSAGVDPSTARQEGSDIPTAPTELPGASVLTSVPQIEKVASPWGAAADAGVAVGRGSQKAAIATAGFFTRLGKSIAGAVK